MADRLRYAINNCRSIDMDNYMLSRNTDGVRGSDEEWGWHSSYEPINVFITESDPDPHSHDLLCASGIV